MVSAGAKVRAIDIPTGAVTTYTPTWTGSTTNPTNYTGTGYYYQLGKWVHVHAAFTCNASFTAGSGTYNFSLPSSVTSNYGLEDVIGVGLFRHPGTSARYSLLVMPTGTGSNKVLLLSGGSTVTALTNASPLAPLATDRITFDCKYFVD